jgi:hypothetical protein
MMLFVEPTIIRDTKLRGLAEAYQSTLKMKEKCYTETILHYDTPDISNLYS